jgi:hypothetical protein
MEAFHELAGFGTDEHLLEMLGDTWAMFVVPLEPPFEQPLIQYWLEPWIGLKVNLRDRQAFVAYHEKLVRRVREMAAGPESAINCSITETLVEGATIYFLEWQAEAETPLPLFWCITDDALVMATSSKLIERMLNRPPDDPGLAAVPAVAATIDQGNVTMLGYHDPRPVVAHLLGRDDDSFWTWIPSISDAVDPLIDARPPASGITSRTAPAISVVRTIPGKGILVESSSTLPLGPLATIDLTVRALEFQNAAIWRAAMHDVGPKVFRPGEPEAAEPTSGP